MTSAARTFATISSPARPTGNPVRLERAVVLGGSVAGLLAARVLAEHAERVVVVERDPLDTGPVARRGVPQGRQVHALLRGGAQQLERWFPGFADRAVAAGAQRVLPAQQALYTDGVGKPGVSQVLCATRPFLEHQVRELVRDLPNVQFRTGRATGLEVSGGAVRAVRGKSGGVGFREAGDLVVDASGRASRVPDQLAAAGWDAPPLTRQATGIDYATALFRRPPGEHAVGLAAALVSPGTGSDVSSAAFTPVEGDRWILVLAGYGTRPGSTAEDLVRLCRRELPAPFGRVASNELLGDVVTHHQGDSRRRDWTAAARLPARLLAVGDAVSSFNPVYGQGMSSAALHASCLSMFLRSGADLDAPARRFFELQRVVVDAAWSVSTGGDRARTGVRPRGPERVAAGLLGLVVDATVVDPVVARVLDDVTQMLEHPARLLAPGVLWRSLRARRLPRPGPTPPVEPGVPEGPRSTAVPAAAGDAEP
ncbi:FAD-dependent oxidoreductase [Kineococcus sp. SYSU DK004]|uniref:FAD-dependent oxidoreductase n=1 Tax=Kineococcus sp. SYSU DK004 TaxID=3383125 RepID=UPI003D7EB223